ncbi:GNAT family N-acetyltransferase [Glaciibacter psychrotolerans]|uniref:Putative acetyltransferase n=1 Tax=Glaciibacter psychrotolerans TaxID=670054 RepID=A0A7Z0EGL1_9MICO|nr:putative acetyltransferase [Leifsonia psychrotolerans]
MTDTARLPLDPTSHAALAADGLHLGLVDPTDSDAARRWISADQRGFLDSAPEAAALEAHVAELGTDRITGVWDRSGADPDTPIATVQSWEMGLTVPGGASVAAWAISSVTVSPTHRRRGIARALLTAELRAAAALGLPLAMLTVSEATIYGRYGFGPAARQAGYTIRTARAGWIGPIPAGRVQFVTRESLLRDGPALFERARLAAPGEVDRSDIRWRHLLGLSPAAEGGNESARGIRAVRYDDADGDPAGFALYRVTLPNDSYPARLELLDLIAATDDAAAALWRFLIEMDLVSEVRAPLRRVSETVGWQISDPRALVKTDERDHLWLRLLDIPAAFAARTFSAPGDIVFSVTDTLGLVTGDYLLSVDSSGRGATLRLADAALDDDALDDAVRDGAAHVELSAADLANAVRDGAAHVELSAADLASVYLGDTSAEQLRRAGRVTAHSADAAIRVDQAFRSVDTPWLSTWF